MDLKAREHSSLGLHIEREGLTMIYAVMKFRYYLLANKFVFFVDHQALLYSVIVFGQQALCYRPNKKMVCDSSRV